jgi:membrane protein implicated in regulation of membrane protease activity
MVTAGWRTTTRGRPVVARDDAVIGRTGELLVGTRGAEGPGEVLVRVRGGTEAFLAWSDDPLPKGATVLVVDSRGTRQVDVIEWADPLDAPAG